MLTLLRIRNIALIDELAVEFGPGLNLLTGETGSGKSIIVDSLGALTGDRVSTDLIKEGESTAAIEGLFAPPDIGTVRAACSEGGFELEGDELIIRRELSRVGKNRIFVNGQLATRAFLKRLGTLLVDIHGQGEQSSLFETSTHLELLDTYAGVDRERAAAADAYATWSAANQELEALRRDASERLQLLDILRFQADEIRRAGLKPGEADELEAEKRRLNNVEKLSALSGEIYTLVYEQDASTLATLDNALRKIAELAEYDERVGEYHEPLETARAVIEDLSDSVRDLRNRLEFSPERLEQIEGRLAEISRVARKYGGKVDTALAHLNDAERRLENIETAEFREHELEEKLAAARRGYVEAALGLHTKRVAAAVKFGKAVEAELKAVALEKARFDVQVSDAGAANDRDFSPLGFDHVEFYFSANPGESPRPLASVASGGEASRLMLILTTVAGARERGKSAVFDEVDSGIGGRVAEAVGLKLRQLSAAQQVLCVTHQPQIAALADEHFIVEKTMGRNRTAIAVRELDAAGRVDEVARMLAGETVTDSARRHAAEMIAAARPNAAAEPQRRRGAKG